MKIINKLISKFKKESCEDIADRVLGLAEEGNYFPFSPPMDAQTAVNELCRFFLGEDWYTTNPISQEQINTEIVYEIECKYKNIRRVKK